MESLPENCIAEIVSFTTPVDACRLAAVSPLWRSAADSNYVWARFLPPEFSDILARAVMKVGYSSLKELFFRFCDSILIDKGHRLVSLKRSNGKISVSLSPRGMVFLNKEEFETFWETCPTSDLSPERWAELELGGAPPAAFRFNGILLLLHSDALGIVGGIHPWKLSEKTYYCARLIFRLSDNPVGFEYPLQASVHQGDTHYNKMVSFLPRNRFSLPPMGEEPYDGIGMAEFRDDGWMELEVGRFFCRGIDERDQLITFWLLGEMCRPMAGLILEGMDVSPMN